MTLTDTNGFASLLSTHADNATIGGLVGLLVGDAVGVPFEFHPPEQIPPRDQIDMQPPMTFRRAHAGVPIGTWSDDGAQALCLLASLNHCGQLDVNDFAGRLVRWFDEGYMAVDGDVFDCGMQTANAIDKLRDGVSPLASGGRSVMDNGNGSLMRALPLALWHTGSDDALVLDAHIQSLPTHAHPRSLVACAFYCLVARGYLNRNVDPWSWADRRLADIYADWSDHQKRQDLLGELGVLRSFPTSKWPSGSGYVLDCLWSARQALSADSFEDVICAAIMFGNDTDTTAAVAGGLAGIRFGLAGIPSPWLERLRGFGLVKPLVLGI